MKQIEIETFLKPMGEGITRPALVIGNDYNEYILKNEDVDQNGKLVKYNCMFVNELLAFQIGKFLNVPMPEAVIALIDGELIEGDPTIRFAYRFEAGKYFATKKLKQIENNYLNNYKELANMNKPYMSKSWNKFFKNIENKKDIPKILAFDLLIANFDRYINTGNILVNREKKDMRNIYAIDHGHAFFGPIWDENKIKCLGIKQITNKYIAEYCSIILSIIRESGPFGSGTIFGVLENYVDLEDVQNHSFSDIIIKMRNINEDIICEWCNNIPNDWYIDKEMQVSYYTNFLMKQKYAVEQIIQMLANNNAFTNYRGGILRYETCEERNLI